MKNEVPLYVVGDKVYRVNYSRIEEGTVYAVYRCDLDSHGNVINERSSEGQYIMHVAQFGSCYENQTYEWKFFKDIKDAQKRLSKEADRHISDLRKKIVEWEDIKLKAQEQANA